ncbi:MAG TPA: hypothetical protein VF989_06985 [Polyangiaceae bacterium]
MSEDDQHQTDSLRASLVDSGWSLPPQPAEKAAPPGQAPARPKDESSALEALAAPRSGEARRPPPPPPATIRRDPGAPLPPHGSHPPLPPGARSGPPPPPSARAAQGEAAAGTAGVSSKPPRELPPYPEARRQSLAEVDDLLGRSDPHEALTTRVPTEELLAGVADVLPETKRGGPEHEAPTRVAPLPLSEPKTIPQALATPLPAFDLPLASTDANAPPTARDPVGAGSDDASSHLPAFDFADPSAPAAIANLGATFPAAQSPLAGAAKSPARAGPSDLTEPRGKSLPAAGNALLGRLRESLADFSARPVWVQRGVKVGAVLVAGAGLGYAAGRLTLDAGTEAAAPVAASVTPPAAPVAPEQSATPEPTSEPEPASVAERARRGDGDAITQLFAKLELTANEAVAVSEGQRRQELARLQTLGKKLAEDASLLAAPESLKKLTEFARDDDTSRETLAILAELDTPESVDLIYEIWTGTRGRTDATALAEALVYSKDVRPKASEALAVALDLRKAETCEERKALIERAVEFADRRSLHLLGKLNVRRGCGPTKREDCNACLGDRKRLAEAIQRARRETGPRF